jgi:ferredoxin
MIAAGAHPGNFEGGIAETTHQDCRTCHEIHTTYTSEDWALTTDADVALYAFEGVTFEGGQGNLCGVCHQPRRQMVAEDGIVNVSSTHWGPHHGPHTAMMLGVGGAGEVEAAVPSKHYETVENTCVGCHSDHSFAPDLVACLECHPDAEDFNMKGSQTEIEALIEELGKALEAKGMWQDGHPVVGEYPEAEAAALWNYIFVAVEDGSRGVHNAPYSRALLEASIGALK